MAVPMADLRKMETHQLLALKEISAGITLDRIDQVLREGAGSPVERRESVQTEPQTFTLPIPPSVNALYLPILPRGRKGQATPIRMCQTCKRPVSPPAIVMSTEGRKWKRRAREQALVAWMGGPLAGPVWIRVRAVFRQDRRDSNNLWKALCDVLEGICYENDLQIVREEMTKDVDPDRGGVVIVTVGPADTGGAPCAG